MPAANTDVATLRAGAVLLVEDNDEVAEVCRSYFQQLGYSVKRAASAQEALEMLENEAGDRSRVFRHPDARRLERS